MFSTRPSAIACLLLALIACKTDREQPPPPELASWARANATDLPRGLHALASHARVIAAGEATHGTSEFFVLKHRMLQYLVEHEGFTIFGIEANLPECFAVNDYVLTGRGDPKQALAGLYFWTWDTYEVLDLIEWMRAWNADPTHAKVKFYGIDMQTTRVAAAMAEDYVRSIDPALAKAHAAMFAFYRNLPANRSTRAQWPAEEPAQLLQALAPRASESDLGMRCVRLLQQANTFSRRFSERDRAMAENGEWILAREGPSSKMMLWAHNGHVAKAPAMTMGAHLAHDLGAQYASIGFVFDQGTFRAFDGKKSVKVFTLGRSRRGTFAAELATLGRSPFMLDLRSAPGDVAKWLDTGVEMRAIGSTFSPGIATEYARTKPREEFDAIVFLDTMHPSHPTPTGERPRHAK